MTEKNETKAITLFHGEAEAVNPLARYHSSRAVRIVADRVMATDKGKTALTHGEALLVAQSALYTGLRPFQPQPELWYWVQTGKGGRRFLTIMRGRDGTIRLAQEAAKREGTYLLPPRYREIVDESERQRLQIPKNALAIEAEVEDQQTSSEWWKNFNSMKDAGYKPEEIDRRLGESPPKDLGMGILTTQEMSKMDSQPGGNKMPHINRCRKRAYVEALKSRWAPRIDYDALSEGAPSDTDDYIVEGEWLELDMSERTLDEDVAEGATDAMFGDGASENIKDLKKKAGERPYPHDVVRQRILGFVPEFKGTRKDEKRGEITLVQYLAWQLNECFLGDKDQNAKRHAVIAYVFDGRTSLNDLTGAELKALEKWLEPAEWDGEGAGFRPRKESRQEAVAMVVGRLKEQGQAEMELTA